MNDTMIPENQQGKQTDLEYAVTAATEAEAADCFTRAWKRMLNPPIWHKLCGTLSASFMLTGEHGDPVSRLAQQNDHICIDIPGPANSAGKGFDWVRIEHVEEDINPAAATEKMGMRVRACANPKTTETVTAHFFDEHATSTFIITRNGKTVTASYHGRNEMPNSATGHVADNIRNTVVALGATAGLSELQWSALIQSFLQEEIGG